MIDSDNEKNVGVISILLTNEGRRVNKNEMPARTEIKKVVEKFDNSVMMPASAPSVAHLSRYKKKIYSKPLEMKTCLNPNEDDITFQRK